MNKIALRMMVASTLLVAGSSLAAGLSAEIKVVGELIAPTCEVKLPGEGIFDYGSISHTKISRDKPAGLGTRGGGTMEVKCDAETAMTFNVIDNRLGSASEAGKTFGLGNVNTTGKLGFYAIQAYFPQVDGKNGALFVTSNTSIPSTHTLVNLEHGKRVGWGSVLRQYAGHRQNLHRSAVGRCLPGQKWRHARRHRRRRQPGRLHHAGVRLWLVMPDAWL